ncbi:BRCA1-associated RING domain protein 1-like [Oratosquilla oratoria]|uniref:BRCA1-associated RING domain protein 1-like n=1 Tax=Oratosquilla oratoria TaxID=337810 RepID=UPI003F7690A7
MSENVGDILDIFSWDKTNTALADLQELLKCHSCHKIAEDPQCLGRCDHFFCNGCVSSLTNNTCPTCRIPSIPTEKKPDRIISGLISSAKDLAHLLSGGHLEIAQPGHEAPVFDATKNEKNIPPPALYDVVKTNKRKASMIPKHPKGKSEKNAENRRNSTKGKVPVVQKKGSALPKKAGSVGNLSVLSSASNKLANVEEKKVQVKGVKKEKELKEKEEKKKEEKKKEEKRKEEKEKEEKKEEKRNEDKENVEKEKEKCGEEAGSSGETGLTKNFFTPNSKKNVSLPDLSLLGLSPTAVGINKRNAKGETSLHVACIKGDVEKVRSLLVNGANPNCKDNANWTPLHEACSHGFESIARLLLKNGALVDVPGNGNDTPLHDAVTNNNLDIVKLLRTYGAKDDIRNLYGYTARALASRSFDPEAMLAALNTQVDNSLKPPRAALPFCNKMVLLGSGLNIEYSKKLECVGKLLHVKVAMEYSGDVSHVVTMCDSGDFHTCHRTIKYMIGVAAGKWILSQKWLDRCLEMKVAASVESFEVSGSTHNAFCRAPSKSRHNAAKLKPGLFSGCHVYLYGSFRPPYPSKKELEALIRAGGGIVLAREPNPESIPDIEKTVPFHTNPTGPLSGCSHYIIYQEGSSEPRLKYDMTHIKSLPMSWLTESLDHFELVSPFK